MRSRVYLDARNSHDESRTLQISSREASSVSEARTRSSWAERYRPTSFASSTLKYPAWVSTWTMSDSPASRYSKCAYMHVIENAGLAVNGSTCRLTLASAERAASSSSWSRMMPGEPTSWG